MKAPLIVITAITNKRILLADFLTEGYRAFFDLVAAGQDD